MRLVSGSVAIWGKRYRGQSGQCQVVSLPPVQRRPPRRTAHAFHGGRSSFLPEVQNNLPFDVNEFVPIGSVAEQRDLGVKQTRRNSRRGDRSREQPADYPLQARGRLQPQQNGSGAVEQPTMTISGQRRPWNDVITGESRSCFRYIAGRRRHRLGCVSCWRSSNWNPNYRYLTVSETIPGFASSGWYPGRTRVLLCDRAKNERDLRLALARPELIRKFGWKLPDPQDLDFVRSERKLWGPIVKQIGIAAQ